MEEDFQSLSYSDNVSNQESDTRAPAEADSFGGVGLTTGAKYRLMSPAKLPISRSNCINVPPGLSPTSFLESPVLLSNIKVEPSPTTGSFFKHRLMQCSGKNVAEMSLERNYSTGNSIDERMSSNFEFNFHPGSNARVKQKGPFDQPQDPIFSQSPSPSSLDKNELPITKESIISSVDELNHKDSTPVIASERTSEDGYNWRKYGQKLVKGSEFPRSYYKCTSPNCEVKKIFERSPSGQITEIVYKGSHDHPKPQAARRQNPGVLLSIQEEKMDRDFSFSGPEDKFNTSNMESNLSPMLSPREANVNALDGSGSQLHTIDEDDPFAKRRRLEDCLDVTAVVKPIREPRVVVQTVSDVDILDDGYRWRKYGQKVVRANPNPRSYYKCTFSGCPVRKHVERASNDPKSVITTYEGKHIHDIPNTKSNGNEFAGPTPLYNCTSNLMLEDRNNSVSLNLGVGISRDDSQNAQDQVARNDQIPGSYGTVNNGLNVYGTIENSVQTRPTQNLGRIL